MDLSAIHRNYKKYSRGLAERIHAGEATINALQPENLDIWQGRLVRLRAVEPEDWQTFSDWDQDTETARLCYFIPFPGSHERARRFAAEQAVLDLTNPNYRWMIENLAGEAVGNINTHNCDPRNGTFQYGLAIRREQWRKGYASEAIQLVLKYFFRELRYQKVNVGIYSFNEASIQLHRKLGFVEEGRLRRTVYTNGAYFDDVLLGMTVEEFEASLKIVS